MASGSCDSLEHVGGVSDSDTLISVCEEAEDDTQAQLGETCPALADFAKYLQLGKMGGAVCKCKLS